MSDKPKIIVLKRPIKNCPHCGGKCSVEILANDTFYVKCLDCFVTNLKINNENGCITGYSDANEAVEKWNRRIREIPVPDCKYCEENDGNEDCPYFGEPDGCNNRELRARVLDGDYGHSYKKPYYPCENCKNRVYNLQLPYDKRGRTIFGCSRLCAMRRVEDFEDGKKCPWFVKGESNVCWP